MPNVILDLSAYREETADIILEGGRKLRLKKPSEKLVIQLLGLRNLDENDPAAVLETLNGVTAAILNNNADGLTFGRDSIETLSQDVKLRIVEAYTEYATQLQARPTASSPKSPARRSDPMSPRS